MSTAETPRPAPRTGRPWFWTLAGLAMTGAGFIWASGLQQGQQPLEFVQIPLVLLGVLAAGVAIWCRCSAAVPATLNDLVGRPRRAAFFALVAVNAVTALAVSAWVVAKIQGEGGVPGDLGGTLLLWLLVAPWAGWSAYVLLQSAADGKPLPNRFEMALLVNQSGVAALLGSWALYWGSDAQRFEQWDSIRLVLAVLAAVAFLAAPLVAANTQVRRLAVSVLILLHFAGIGTVVVGAPPGSWIAQVVHHYVFRPYLEFMYLQNAYRFYSPEPNEASQLWYRIEYLRGNKILSRWEKLPNFDDNGNSRYLFGLQLTRRLALTANVDKTEPFPPSLVVTGKDGRKEMAPFAKARDLQAPVPLEQGVLGAEQAPRDSLMIPYYPDTAVPQYLRPTLEAKELLSSYARYILARPHPDYSDATPTSVRIYRVKHRILPPQAMAMGADPHDMVFYLPYYQGKFDTTGQLLDPSDPFLYWLLPILRVDESHPEVGLLFYVYKHAGEPEQVWKKGQLPRWNP